MIRVAIGEAVSHYDMKISCWCSGQCPLKIISVGIHQSSTRTDRNRGVGRRTNEGDDGEIEEVDVEEVLDELAERMVKRLFRSSQ